MSMYMHSLHTCVYVDAAYACVCVGLSCFPAGSIHDVMRYNGKRTMLLYQHRQIGPNIAHCSLNLYLHCFSSPQAWSA